jgi:TetR/AcrR family transcriptional regulator
MKRQRNPASTRDAILKAGTELFAKHGFEGTRVDGIARRARVNKAMVSYHFGGKKRLYLAILTESLAAARQQVLSLQESGLPAADRMREFIHTFAAFVGQRPYLTTILAREAVSGGRYLDQKLLPQFAGIFSGVREILDQGIRDGSFRPVNPAIAHVSLVGSLIFFYSTEPFRNRILSLNGFGALDPQEFVRYLQETMIHGLTPEPDLNGPATPPGART